jgi:hypothetical protein
MLHDPRGLILGGSEALWDIESSKCGHAFDQGGFDAPYAGQFELRPCGVAGALDCDLIWLCWMLHLPLLRINSSNLAAICMNRRRPISKADPKLPPP